MASSCTNWNIFRWKNLCTFLIRIQDVLGIARKKLKSRMKMRFQSISIAIYNDFFTFRFFFRVCSWKKILSYMKMMKANEKSTVQLFIWKTRTFGRWQKDFVPICFVCFVNVWRIIEEFTFFSFKMMSHFSSQKAIFFLSSFVRNSNFNAFCQLKYLMLDIKVNDGLRCFSASV